MSNILKLSLHSSPEEPVELTAVCGANGEVYPLEQPIPIDPNEEQVLTIEVDVKDGVAKVVPEAIDVARDE
ncbi:hypothetical protein HN512_03795 [Candidatus Peregrinibacteria bacterium]|jgi:hypothetical protein|nr:hypothetical protein [Candidatus Peregrinibacteria bacterium]MBT3598935.1 hypothetical protein [Candidatus Peregrinibacteria bacterium]MBT4367177.1 hypothetical protein [Candidatus Peregrinibacteria bacterium]MBT4586019.1 hypothetical protein [Candidatus Peregrinibacteria bacterium]MBT6730622.1 hypothetical protein [Candidatus Peregrinibacteria bacterium]